MSLSNARGSLVVGSQNRGRAQAAEDRDATDPEVLVDIADPLGVERRDLIEALATDDTKRETWADFAVAQNASIRGFAALLAGRRAGEPYAVIRHGYQPPERILTTLATLLEAPRADEAADHLILETCRADGRRDPAQEFC